MAILEYENSLSQIHLYYCMVYFMGVAERLASRYGACPSEAVPLVQSPVLWRP